MIKVYYFDISLLSDCIDVNSIKIENIKNEILKYKEDKDRLASYYAWTKLISILKDEYNINSFDIKKNEHNKAYLKNNELYFNISHSNNMIAIIISDLECGIDIEMVDNKKDHDKLSKKILNEKELIDYNNSKDKLDFLIKMWTIKESYLKMLGTGIVSLNFDIDYKKNKGETLEVLDNNNNKYYLSYFVK